jgi:hypothetical protein
MTAYRGTITITLNGVLEGSGAFSAFAPITIDLFNASLAGDGTLSGTFAGSGLLSVTAGGTTASEFLTLPSTPFSTSLSSLALPFGTSVPGLTIVWNETNTFNPQRTAVTSIGMGTFSGVVNGVAASGTVNASGTLSAMTSAYSIAGSAVATPEGNSGTTAFTFNVTRLGATDGFGTVAWQVPFGGPSGASATDFLGFTMPSGTLTFNAGEVQKSLTVEVLGDELIEGDETFDVVLATAPGEVIAAAPSAQGVIGADDFATISIAPLLADVAEGGVGQSTAFTFTISRSGSTAQGAGVDWAVRATGGTPASAADFAGGVLPAGTVSFLPGEASQTVTVLVAGDGTQEAQESFMVELSTPTGGAGLSDSTAPGLIINDDGGTGEVADSAAMGPSIDMGDGSDLVLLPAARSSYQIGRLENHIHLEGPGGVIELANVEWLKFGTAPAISWQTLYGQPETEELMRFLITNGGGSQEVFALPMRYSGPLDLAYVYPGTNDDDVVAGTSLNDFVNLQGGNDAANMGAGNDIVDGGGGSNFLTGGAGADAFFLDGRFAVPVWSCITDWEIGESLTIWGWRPGVSVGAWGENAGLPGYLGATFFADIDGSGAVETVVTFTGRSVAEMPAPAMLDVGGIGVLKFG